MGKATVRGLNRGIRDGMSLKRLEGGSGRGKTVPCNGNSADYAAFFYGQAGQKRHRRLDEVRKAAGPPGKTCNGAQHETG